MHVLVVGAGECHFPRIVAASVHPGDVTTRDGHTTAV